MLPVTLLRLPYSLLEAVVWSIIVYWSVGFAPDAGRVRPDPGSGVLMPVLAESGERPCHTMQCNAACGHLLPVQALHICSHVYCAGPQFFWFMFILFLVRGRPRPQPTGPCLRSAPARSARKQRSPAMHCIPKLKSAQFAMCDLTVSEALLNSPFWSCRCIRWR